MELVSHIGNALRGCGKEDEVVKSLQHFDIFRNHFQIMLFHQFPQQFDAVLRILLEGKFPRFSFLNFAKCDDFHFSEIEMPLVVVGS